VSDSSDEIFAKLKDIVTEFFPDYGGPFDRSVATEDVPGWDSTSHVGLIVEIEDRFGIVFEPEDYAQFKTLGELVDMIKSKS
jgi:acyl carrier protein